MEVLNLLKFWKTSPSHDEENSTTTTHIDLSIDGSSDNEVVDEEDDSFFELKITAPDYYNVKNRDTQQQENNIKNHKNGEENVEDFKHQAKTGFAQNDVIFAESNLSRFKCRRILPIEPTSKPQSPISILKSAPKFRIFMLGSKTRKPEKTESNRAASSMETPKHSQQGNKKFTLKINLEEDEEEEAHSLSLFTRVNSSRTTGGSKLQKQSTNESSPIDSSKRFSKDVVQKYLKLIKPFYVKVSKRYSDRVKLSDLLYSDSPASSPSPAAVVSPKNVPAGFRVISKHLGKSRSASAAVGVVSPAVASRRDDSLLQQDDGIQSAIQHCKRSFNSSRGESCLLSRCTSDTTHEKLTEPWRKSTEEAVDGC